MNGQIFTLTRIVTLSLCLLQISAQTPTPCVRDADTQQQGVCIVPYQPVCGINKLNGNLETYGNYCVACQDSNVDFYFEFPCEGIPEEINPEEESDQPPISDYTQCPPIRTEFCTRIYQPVCGLSDQTIQCLIFPCGADFSNGCVACSDKHVIGYHKGTCAELRDGKDHPSDEQEEYGEESEQFEEYEAYEEHEESEESEESEEQNDQQLDQQYFKCPKKIDSLPQMFEFILNYDKEVCGLYDPTLVKCIQYPCGQDYPNSYQACSNSNIVQYYKGTCEELRNPSGNTSGGDDQTEQQPQEPIQQCPKYCQGKLKKKQSICGLFNQNIQCIRAPCGQTYDSICAACNDPNVDTYQKGACNDQLQLKQLKHTDLQQQSRTIYSIILSISAVIIMVLI